MSKQRSEGDDFTNVVGLGAARTRKPDRRSQPANQVLHDRRDRRGARSLCPERPTLDQIRRSSGPPNRKPYPHLTGGLRGLSRAPTGGLSNVRSSPTETCFV